MKKDTYEQRRQKKLKKIENKMKKTKKERMKSLDAKLDILRERDEEKGMLHNILSPLQFNEKEFDEKKLKKLAKEDNKYLTDKKTCPMCASEIQYCPYHQKAERYLNAYYYRHDPKFYYYYRKYIED